MNYMRSVCLFVFLSLGSVSAQILSFGGVSVGSKAPVQTLTYNFTSGVTLSAVNILTTGATALDYTDGGSSTCAAGNAYSAGQSCAVTVAFTPSAPGLRSGAVVLFAQGSTIPLMTWYLNGIGLSGAVTMDPGSQSTIATLSNNGLGYGAAVDGASDIYVVDYANSQIIELSAGTLTQSTVVSSGLSNPTALALDGAGNLYISDTGNSRVLMVPNEQAGLNTGDMSVLSVPGLGSPTGLACDGSGNIYVADAANGDVVELPQNGGAPITVASGLTSPAGIAVDSAGNVYVASSNQVTEFPASGGTPIPLGSGYSSPSAVAVDASGAVYVADSGNSQVVMVAPGGTSQVTLAFTGLSSPKGIAVDASANVYITDSGNVYELNRTQAASLAFASTIVGSTSAPQTLTVSDAGTQALTFSSLTASTNFAVNKGTTTCSTSSSLPPGAACNVGVACAPAVIGPLTGTLTLSDNALNGSPATQQVSLSCTGTGTAPIITSGNNATFTVGTSGTFIVTTSGAPAASLSESGSMPSGITFVDNGNGTATLGGVPAAGTGGSYNVVITAANGISPNATQSFTVAVDQPPAITSGNNTTFTVGSSGAFTVTTTAYPTAGFTETGGALPSGVTFVDNGNGTATLDGTPSAGTAGVYNFTISAQNGVSPNAAQSFTLTIQSNAVGAAVAARFLEQSSWGPTATTIAQVQGGDLPTYLQQQFSAPISTYPTNPSSLSSVQTQFFVNAMNGQDQLRQRVSFALSEIFVISLLDSSIQITPSGFSSWMNTLQNDAFGNFFQLLNDVTLNPGMGTYLNMANNNGCATCRPNENFAREVMQLFTIGMEELNPDGSLVLDQNGNPIPTYSQNTIDGLSQVFTGWTYAPAPGKTGAFGDPPYYGGPMIPFQAKHSNGSKLLLNGVTLPSGGSIQSDLNSALENIFTHPNVAPFICSQLIQKLVTSNPIPEYVSRCSQVFNNDGTGVAGDMQAVISEILLDPEARRGDVPSQVQPTDGHLREPLLHMMFVMRALNTTTNGVGPNAYPSNMGQPLFESPTVFNFYPPNWELPGLGILGPEFAIFGADQAFYRVNFIYNLIYSSLGSGTTINIAPYVAVAGNVSALLNMINANLMHGAMPSDMYSTLLTTLSNKSVFTTPTSVAQAALFLVETSSQFEVED